MQGKEPKGASQSNDPYSTMDGLPRTKYTSRLTQEQRDQLGRCQRMHNNITETDPLVGGSLAEIYKEECLRPGTPIGSTLPQPDPPPSPYLLGAQAVTQLTIPAPTPMIGPDPSINKWNMAVVNYPYWLWTQDPTTLTSSTTVQGYTVALSARRTRVQFATGDGTVLTCTRTTPWARGTAPNLRSPTCGHTYREPSKPHHYRLRALAHWQVTWSVLGESGTIPVTTSDSRQLLVGELAAVLVPNR